MLDNTKIDIITDNIDIYKLKKLSDKGKLFCSFYNIKPTEKINNPKSSIIETIFIKIPLPSILIDNRDEDTWKIESGSHIIGNIFDYMENKFQLSGMEYLPELNGKKFFELERKYQRRIEDCSLHCVMIRPNTPENIAINIYDRFKILNNYN